MASEISRCIVNSHLRWNSIGYPWNDWGGHVLHIMLLSVGGIRPILRVSRALQDVRVSECGEPEWGAGRSGSVGTTVDQMLEINQSHWHGVSHQVTSCSVPNSFKLIKMYDRKTEAIATVAKVKCIWCLEKCCELGLKRKSYWWQFIIIYLFLYDLNFFKCL